MKTQKWISFILFLWYLSSLVLNCSMVYSLTGITDNTVWDKLHSSNPPLVIDTRTLSSYIESHIPTAICIAWSGSFNDTTIDLILSYNYEEIVTYCSCPEGSNAKECALFLQEEGLSTVYYMQDDYRYWPYDTISGSERGILNASNSIINEDNNGDNDTNNDPSFGSFLLPNLFLIGIIITIIIIRKKYK